MRLKKLFPGPVVPADGADPRTSAGALYGLIGPASRLARPAGEVNETRLVVRESCAPPPD